MYADLGPGQMVELDPPSPNGVDVLYSHEYVAERMRERSLYGYCGNDPTTLTDPSGLYSIDASCKGLKRKRIQMILQEIRSGISAAINANKNCFPGGTNTECREDLNQCLMDTLGSGIKIVCKSTNSRSHGGTTGQCVSSKNNPLPKHPDFTTRPQNKECESDPGCKACPREYLAHSTINLYLPDKIGTMSLQFLAHLILHELLHNCVGGHLIPGDPDLGRPDAKGLAKEYLANCGRPYKIREGRPVPIDK